MGELKKSFLQHDCIEGLSFSQRGFLDFSARGETKAEDTNNCLPQPERLRLCNMQ